ncbi:MAG TPA: enoyl-CoA hydratase-related protein, partial [Rhizomicrobium sp.]
AIFVQGFVSIGLVPDGGSTWLLPRLIGLARARELSLLAEKLPAERALAWGLINRVADDTALMNEALALAMKLADGPASIALTRKLFWESPHRTYEEQLELERRAQARAGRTEDFIEGRTAFQEKRSPKFKGR